MRAKKQIQKAVKKAAKTIRKAEKRIGGGGVKLHTGKRRRNGKILHGDEMVSYASNVGSRIGRKLGGYAQGFIDRVFGYGDYTIVPGGAYINGHSQNVPHFGGGRKSVRIRHSECLGDMSSSTNFQISSYLINPGNSATFPWLSLIASNFEQYKFHGCLFFYKSTSANALNSTNTALGTVIMATDYDVLDANFTNKISMESYEGAISSKPSESFVHGVEFARKRSTLNELYIYDGTTLVGDPHFYNFGNFQIATVGSQASAVIGELWVTYDVELLKPKTPVNLDIPSSYGHWSNVSSIGGSSTAGNGSGLHPFGVNGLTSIRSPLSGSNIQGVSVGGVNGAGGVSDAIYCTVPNVTLIIVYMIAGDAGITGVPGNPVVLNCTSATIFRTSSLNTESAFVVNTNAQAVYAYRTTGATSQVNPASLNFNGQGAVGSTSGQWDLMVFILPSTFNVDLPLSMKEMQEQIKFLMEERKQNGVVPSRIPRELSFNGAPFEVISDSAVVSRVEEDCNFGQTQLAPIVDSDDMSRSTILKAITKVLTK